MIHVYSDPNLIQTSIPTFQQKLKRAADILGSTVSLELILRVASKAMKFYMELVKAHGERVFLGCAKLSLQLDEGIETLGVVQTPSYIYEVLSVDEKGLYLFNRVSWQKCASRVFMLCYSLLTDLKVVAKFGFVQLGKIEKVALLGLTPLGLGINGTYIFYRFFAAWEGAQTKVWWKVVVSIGKIAMTVLGIAFSVQNITSIPCLVALSGLSLGFEGFDTAKKLGFL